MNNTDVIKPDVIQVERFYSYPPAAVWRALTDPVWRFFPYQRRLSPPDGRLPTQRLGSQSPPDPDSRPPLSSICRECRTLIDRHTPVPKSSSGAIRHVRPEVREPDSLLSVDDMKRRLTEMVAAPPGLPPSPPHPCHNSQSNGRQSQRAYPRPAWPPGDLVEAPNVADPFG